MVPCHHVGQHAAKPARVGVGCFFCTGRGVVRSRRWFRLAQIALEGRGRFADIVQQTCGARGFRPPEGIRESSRSSGYLREMVL